MEEAEPAKKKLKGDDKNKTQTSILGFFSARSNGGTKEETKKDDSQVAIPARNAPVAGGKPMSESSSSGNAQDSVMGPEPPKVAEAALGNKVEEVSSAKPASNSSAPPDRVPEPIVPTAVKTPRDVTWQSLHDNFIIVRKPSRDPPRNKVAAFDLDGTLVAWSSSFAGFWPNQLSHYELWSSTIPARIRKLYDEGFKIVLFTNQGGIQKAHSGKKATLIKSVVDWLASVVDRPIHAVLSTRSHKKSDDSYHKPSSKMWKVAVTTLNKRLKFDLSQSFFVGDSADPDDPQGGVDLKFAQAVANAYGDEKDTLKFYTPTEYFGPSDGERRQKQSVFQGESPPPKQALSVRSALLGGYLQGPILLILCGVQGSGKSTFAEQLIDSSDHWRRFSQDTIQNGKPGKREKVEAAALEALEAGHSVVIDRMHLDPEQREYFVKVAQSANVPAHVLLLNPPKDVVSERVKNRNNHPGKVQGESGVRIALAALDKLIAPTYAEEVQLITTASSVQSAKRMAGIYKAVGGEAFTPITPSKFFIKAGLFIPSISLGTMGMGRKVTKDAVTSAVAAGFLSIDTAPTYKNEDRVGDALLEIESSIFCIAKVPKSAVQPEQVRSALISTLEKLQRSSVELLLLHWPCDVIAAGTLASVWKEMETCARDGLCSALGVCNFNTDALAMLLCDCSIRPVVNQVERHPLLPQMELLDFCSRHNILLQAHTPLGHGKETLLCNPIIDRIAKEASMSPAQTVLQWNVQHGALVTPKCSKEGHAVELLSCKRLSPEQMRELDSIGQEHRFVAPPFMFGSAPYCWGDRVSRK